MEYRILKLQNSYKLQNSTIYTVECTKIWNIIKFVNNVQAQMDQPETYRDRIYLRLRFARTYTFCQPR